MSYAAIIPPLDRSLAALAAILTKAEAHCAQHNIDPAVLTRFRLYPDMFDFTRQVQLTCDFAARCAARLSGAEVPGFPDTETTFAQLLARVATARAYLAGCPAEAFKDADSRVITLKLRNGDLTLDGAAFRTSYAMPQVYFHFTTAYNILRHNGVAVGKMDFMGA